MASSTWDLSCTNHLIMTAPEHAHLHATDADAARFASWWAQQVWTLPSCGRRKIASSWPQLECRAGFQSYGCSPPGRRGQVYKPVPASIGKCCKYLDEVGICGEFSGSTAGAQAPSTERHIAAIK